MIPNFINLCLCFALGWSAMCRLAMMHERVTRRTAWLYVALFVVSAVSGLQFFLLGTLATWSEVALSGIACAVLLVSVPRWRAGPPRCCLRV